MAKDPLDEAPRVFCRLKGGRTLRQRSARAMLGLRSTGTNRCAITNSTTHPKSCGTNSPASIRRRNCHKLMPVKALMSCKLYFQLFGPRPIGHLVTMVFSRVFSQSSLTTYKIAGYSSSQASSDLLDSALATPMSVICLPSSDHHKASTAKPETSVTKLRFVKNSR